MATSKKSKKGNILKKIEYPILISSIALVISTFSLYFQFFYSVNDFKVTPMKGSFDDNYITLDIAIINSGNYPETIMDIMFFCHDVRNTRVAYICSDQNYGNIDDLFKPVIVDAGQAYHHREHIPYSLDWFRTRRKSTGDDMYISLAIESLGSKGQIITDQEVVMHLTYNDKKISRYKISTFMSDLLEEREAPRQLIDHSTTISDVDESKIIEAHDKWLQERAKIKY